MKPSIGRIVHYVDEGGDCMAAMIVGVNSSSPTAVNLTVFGPLPGQVQARRSVLKDDMVAGVSGTWHWPERVD